MVRLRVKRGDFFDADGNIVAKKDAQSPAGHIIEMYVEKTKVCRWDRKLGLAHLDYTKSIDILQDTIDTAIMLNLIDNSVQGTFKLIDPDTGNVLLDENGEELKVRGKRNIKPYFEAHPEVFKRLYDKCYELLTRKDDTNIETFEKLMNINVTDVIGEHSDEE